MVVFVPPSGNEKPLGPWTKMFSVLRVINLLSCTKRRNIFRGTAIIQGSKAKVIMHNPQKLLTKNNIFLPRKYL